LKILVAVDKNEESLVALRFACHLMEHFIAIVDALYVKPDVTKTIAEGGGYGPFITKGDVQREIETEADKTVEEIIESCEICVGRRIPCNPMLAVGDPAEEILHAANRGYYDMIILGSHSSSWVSDLVGAAQNTILQQAQQPVMILRNFRPIRKILVASRGSQCDQGALEFISPLFVKQKPEITIMHVRETELEGSEELAQACLVTGDETLRQHGHTPVKKMAKGDFVEEILKAVAVERYDLLVLGAYDHKLPKYLKAISDEALNLVRLTTRPVLVYREQK
jgi:nucleotide-binding universal stress UspA family protein